jgi:ParB/RepB/Spo0J family partition protein
MLIKFKDILPNPNRDLKANPLDADKIAELVSSINTTGFWDNVVVRRCKDQTGKFELAYGHHRLAAAIAAGLTDADFIVKDFDDELMIKVMDNENREAYGTGPLSLIESVRAVVKGLAEGRVRPFTLVKEVRKDSIRYAPSFVPGVDVGGSSPQLAYTAMDVAKFLGRMEAKDAKRIKPEDSIIAALNALHLMELGRLKNTELFKEKLVRAPEGTSTKATTVKIPLTTNELLTLTTEIKRDVEVVQERRGKTAAELSELREKQLAAQKKAKEDEDKAEADRKALVRSMAEAKRAENEKKQDRIAAEIREKDERAKAKEALHQQRVKELDAKIAAVKAWEAEQRVEDTYAPIRRDVEAFISKYETKISERNPEREAIKSLASRKGLRPIDRTRAQKALREYANWLYDWALPQLAPELKAAQKVAVEKRKAVILRTKGSGA